MTDMQFWDYTVNNYVCTSLTIPLFSFQMLYLNKHAIEFIVLGKDFILKIDLLFSP